MIGDGGQPINLSDNVSDTAVTEKVVDEAMRTDKLGPNILRVLKKDLEVNEHFNKMVAKAVKTDIEVVEALKQLLADYGQQQTGKAVLSTGKKVAVGLAGALVLAGVSAAIGHQL